MSVPQNLKHVEILGSNSQLQQIVEEYKVDRIIVALDDRRGKLPVQDLVSCKFKGIAIDDSMAIQEELTGKIMTNGLNPSWIIFSRGFNKSKIFLVIKRLVDILLSSILLIMSSPLAIMTMFAVKLDSPGPIFYVQTRVGEKEKRFDIIKFRSMYKGAEKASGPLWAAPDDHRVTRVGRIIRKLRIDEIPQLYNILRGDMSFVGPRPERPVFVDELKKVIPYYAKRFWIKPGLTGWAQVNYPYGASVEDAVEKLQYELYYIKHMSLALDLAIILQTAKVVLLRKGAR